MPRWEPVDLLKPTKKISHSISFSVVLNLFSNHPRAKFMLEMQRCRAAVGLKPTYLMGSGLHGERTLESLSKARHLSEYQWTPSWRSRHLAHRCRLSEAEIGLKRQHRLTWQERTGIEPVKRACTPVFRIFAPVVLGITNEVFRANSSCSKW